MQVNRLRDKLRQYRQKQNYKVLQERLTRVLGSVGSEANWTERLRIPLSVGSSSKHLSRLEIFCENVFQMRELVGGVLQHVTTGRWVVWMEEDYPELVVPDEVLRDYLWDLLDEFGYLRLRKPKARVFSIGLDIEDFYLSVSGKSQICAVYDQYASMVARDYDWNIFSDYSLCERKPFSRTQTCLRREPFIACLICITDVPTLGMELLAKIKSILKVDAGREMREDQNTIVDPSTNQWLCIGPHSPPIQRESMWRVESIGQEFVGACMRALAYIHPKIVTEIRKTG